MSAFIRVDVTPDTPAWAEERRLSVGASEAGGLIAESHFGKTPLSIYLNKIGRSRERFDPIKSYITHAAEPIMEEVFSRKHSDIGVIEPGFMARSTTTPELHATFDRIIVEPSGERFPLQFKTAHPYTRYDWEDGPLPDYLAQEDVECYVLGAPYAYLFTWFWGSNPEDFVLYKLPARKERQQELTRRAEWLMRCVENRTPPVASLGDDIAALYPAVGGKVVRADADTLETVQALRETAAIRRSAVAEWAAVEDDMKLAIELFMGDATELVNPHTNNLIHTWRVNKNGERRHFSPKTEDFA